jgi:hypothetical protein
MCELTEEETNEIAALDDDLEDMLEQAEAGAENDIGNDDSDNKNDD